MSMLRSILLASVAVAAPSHAAAPLSPLDAPEAAYWHADSGTWFVSNLGGGVSLARDGVGWLARYDADGRLLDPRWVAGMDAPTGMASVGNLLYVADRAGVHEVDVRAARILRTLEIPGSRFLNDVAATPDGDLFVSDFEANRIYRLGRDRKAEVWLEGAQLQNPNGLIVDGEHLVIATWGPMTDPATFAVRHPGTLLRAHLVSKSLAAVGAGAPIASFDGIVVAGEGYFATDWPGGRLLRISRDGEVREVLGGFFQLADLGYSPETRTIALPVMSDDRLILLRLDSLQPPAPR